MKHYSDPYKIMEDLKNQGNKSSYLMQLLIIIITTAIGSAIGSAIIILSAY